MPPVRLTCPECDARFRLAQAPPAGKKVRCPECDELFRPAIDDNSDITPKSKRREYDDEPRRSKGRGKRPAKKSNAAVILIPVIAIAVLLLGGGAVAAVFLWPSKTKSTPASGPVAMKSGPKGSAPSGPVGLEIGNVAMEIEGEDIEGQSFRLSDYRGKVVVLDFWGHW